MAMSKWDSVKEKIHLVEKWARDGLTEEQICKNLRISVATLEKYKKQHPEMLKALKKGKEVLITELENALIRRALGYDYEEKKVYTKNKGKQLTISYYFFHISFTQIFLQVYITTFTF